MRQSCSVNNFCNLLVNYNFHHLIVQRLWAPEALKKVLDGKYALIDLRTYISIIIESQYTDSFGQSPFYISRKGLTIMAVFGWGCRLVATLPTFYNIRHGMNLSQCHVLD